MIKKIVLNLILTFFVLMFITPDEKITQADSWEPINCTQEDTPMISVIKHIKGIQDLVLVGYENGMVYKTYNGNSETPQWEAIIPESANSIHGGHAVTGIVVNPYNIDEIYVSFGGERYGIVLWKSNDGGNNWTPLLSAGIKIWNISINPIDNMLYIVTDYYIYTSNDSGETWSNTPVSNETPGLTLEESEEISFVAYLPSNIYHLFVGTTNGRVFEKKNVFNNFEEWDCIFNEVPGKRITSISVKDNGDIGISLAASSSIPDYDENRLWIKKSCNEWKCVDSTSFGIYAKINNINFHPFIKNVLYTSYYYEQAYRSTDNGNTWTANSSGSGKNLKILYRNGDFDFLTNNQIKPQIILKNYGSVDINLDDITIKYWYTIDEEDTQQFNIDYTSFGAENISGTFNLLYDPPYSYNRKDADYSLELGFNNSIVINSDGIPGIIEMTLNKNLLCNYNELNDYSFSNTNYHFIESQNITIYKDNELIWGFEPEIIK